MLTLDGYPHKGQPIMLTEFGGIACRPGEQNGGVHEWGYSMADDEHQFAERYEQLLNAVIHCTLFSGFCYTQFADTFQEANGLLCADRSPKIPLERIFRAVTAPRAHVFAGGV